MQRERKTARRLQRQLSGAAIAAAAYAIAYNGGRFTGTENSPKELQTNIKSIKTEDSIPEPN